MLRVGLVDIETSHRNVYTQMLHAGSEARVVAVCPGSVATPEEVETFIRTHDIRRVVETPAEIADKVDIAFILGTNWDRHLELARPFVEKGKIVFIDKPIVGTIADCERVEQWVRDGARIVGASSLRYWPELTALRREAVDMGGGITYVAAIAGNHYFEYGIHAAEMIGGLLGTGARSVRYLGGEMPAVHHVAFINGACATLRVCGPKGTKLSAEVAGTMGYRQVAQSDISFYQALIDELMHYAHGRPHALASIDALTESVRMMLAANESRRRGGREVFLADLGPDTASFDGAAFATEYGAKKRAQKGT